MTHRILRDLPFSVVPGFRPISLDLHLPEPTDAPRPVVLQLHGGGWRMGSRTSFSPLVSVDDSFGRIVAAGFAVVAADYRLSGEAVYPAQLDDARAALTWICEHATEHGLDPERIVLWGGSAGGTIAALVGLDPTVSVRGVIDWYGPTDLRAMAEHTADQPHPTREDLWLGTAVEDAPELADAASPVNRVHAGAPPFHLAHGLADTDVLASQTTTLADALRAADVPVELELVPDVGHFWKGADRSLSDSLFDRAIAFALRVTDPTERPS
jgi:acetyl esterase/lipase